MLIEDWQAKDLYINKLELESALGIRLDGIKTRKFSVKKEISKDLLPYCSMAYFNDVEAVALLQGIVPQNYDIRKDKNFYPIHKALTLAIEKGEMPNSSIEYNPSDYDELIIEHFELEIWAKYYGYKWELPPYNPIKQEKINSQSSFEKESAETNSVIEQLQVENDKLKAEISELNKQLQQNGVNYENFSIYGHSTPAIKAIFETINRFWINHDITQPDTIANADDIEKWIRARYSETVIGKTLASAIQKITRPPEAKTLGSKGNNKRGNPF